MPDLPSFSDLPIAPNQPPGSSWGVWGDGDVFGCLNLLTSERVKAGIAAVVDGAVFALNFDQDLPDPPLFGRPQFRHEVSGLGGGVGHDEELSGFNTQSSSQWDGFRHIRHPDHGFYCGVADEDHGIHHWARRGIAGRAVMCDVSRWRAADGRPIDPGNNDGITPEDVRSTLSAQGVDVEPGDVLLLHTGWTDWYRSLDAEGRAALTDHRTFRAPGLVPGTDTAALLWDLHIAAIASDNPAVEMWPPASIGKDPSGFLHFHLLALLGMPLGELWELGPLAAACAADGRYTSLLTSAPLNLKAGVASPPNALAIR